MKDNAYRIASEFVREYVEVDNRETVVLALGDLLSGFAKSRVDEETKKLNQELEQLKHHQCPIVPNGIQGNFVDHWGNTYEKR